MFRRLALASTPLRSNLLPIAQRYGRPQQISRYSTELPSITQASFWESMIPKPLRRSNAPKVKKPKSKEWNPATFFIVIMLFIGSMSIQMIALRNDFAAFMRRSDARIDLLREVIQRVKNGEEVDVEGLLGTGNPEKENEWEEVLKEIEKEDELWMEARKKKPIRRSKTTEEPAVPAPDSGRAGADAEASKPETTSNAPRGFF